MIIFIQLLQDICIPHHCIHIHQVLDIGYQDITIIIIFLHTHHITHPHFIVIIYIQDPTIHHITGEIILLIHTYIIVHIYQDIHQLEAGHIMIMHIIDQFQHIDHIIAIIIQVHYIHHIIHHIPIEIICYQKK